MSKGELTSAQLLSCIAFFCLMPGSARGRVKALLTLAVAVRIVAVCIDIVSKELTRTGKDRLN